MPSLGDSAVIILLGLLLFGPKGLAQVARQLGKLMGEFRRASNEFRMQMEEELRLAEQADRQKEIAAIEAAAPPPAPVLGASAFDAPASDAPTSDAPTQEIPEDRPARSIPSDAASALADTAETAPVAAEPLPIATAGDLKIMPPATGLPQPRSSSVAAPVLASLVESIPHADPQETVASEAGPDYADQRPNRYTNGHGDASGLIGSETKNMNRAETPATEESLHG
jgi:sec-independent protein translocase protein TatB